MFYGKISALDKKLQLTAETALLIRQQVARINICAFCIDAGRLEAIRQHMKPAKFDALGEYKTSPLFNPAEKAALDYSTELTQDKSVTPDTFAQLAKYYTEREVCEIVYLIASEHVYNLTNIGLNIHSDELCDIFKKTK